MQKVFLDTNIILDFLKERKEFYEGAAKVLTLANKKKIKDHRFHTSITNAYYILAKHENATTVRIDIFTVS